MTGIDRFYRFTRPDMLQCSGMTFVLPRVWTRGTRRQGCAAVCRKRPGLTDFRAKAARGNVMPRLFHLVLTASVAGALPPVAQADLVLSSNDGHTVMDAQKN